MGLFSTLVKSPLFLRTAGGALAGGVVFHHAAAQRENQGGDISAVSKAGTTLLGMATGAAIGATFPVWKQGIANKYRKIHGGYEGVLNRVAKESEAAWTVKKAAAEKEALGKGFARGSKEFTDAMEDFKTAPSKKDFGVQVKAGLETYMKPSIVMPAGMLVGAAMASNRGEDPLAGAMKGGLAAGALGLGYHSYQNYSRLKKLGPLGRVARGAIGAGMVGTAGMIGMATNPPEYREQARAVSTYDGYEAETMSYGNYDSGAGRRSMDIGATGDLVFGLHNMR